MPRHSGNSEKAFGYLTAIESSEHGYFGGYLVVSQLGRPLEFHCSAPIRASRAQRILYGPTLEPYLLGEQIAGALLGVAKLTPSVILTDCESMLHARQRFDRPVAWLKTANQSCEASASTGVTDGSRHSFSIGELAFGTHVLQLPLGYENDEREVVDALTLLSQQVELAEPFARICDAVAEAQRIGGRGADAHEQAA
jgi:hypothetical protein